MAGGFLALLLMIAVALSIAAAGDEIFGHIIILFAGLAKMAGVLLLLGLLALAAMWAMKG